MDEQIDRRSIIKEDKPPYLKIGIFVILIVWFLSSYLLHIEKGINSISVQTESSAALKAEIGEYRKEVLLFKEYAYLTLQNDNLYSKNFNAYNINEESKLCASCHLSPNMYLLKSRLSLEQFEEYVRGSKRNTINHEMPMFSKEVISDRTLESMYLILKQGMKF